MSTDIFLTLDLEHEAARIKEIWTKQDWYKKLTQEQADTRVEEWIDHRQKQYADANSTYAKHLEYVHESNFTHIPLNEDNFTHFTWSGDGSAFDITLLGLDNPVLMIGVYKTAPYFQPQVRDTYPVGGFSNQCGGHACTHPTMYGVIVPMTDLAYKLYTLLNNRWLDSQISAHGNGTHASFEDLCEYDSILQKCGVSANRSYQHFQEGWYPVDAEYLPLLADIGLDPENGDTTDWWHVEVQDNQKIEAMMEEQEGEKKIFATLGLIHLRYPSLQCAILGENSD